MASEPAVRSFYEKVCAETLPKTPLFAASLDKYMESQKKQLPFMNEPWIVRKCCDHLRDFGLKSEGIFRVPGSATTIKKLSDSFDAGQNPDFAKEPAYVDDVAGVLKKYLRDLPEPLISDGTAEDALQKEFMQVTIDMEDEDELGPYLAKLNALLKRVPIFRRAVLSDLFHLFACISAYQQYNLMGAENVATIFGGMTDIMTSLMTGSQRSRLVRVMIENYVTVFDGVYELEERPQGGTTGKETKEGIRVYLHDGTFKSLFCQSSEICKDIEKKAIAKIQQTEDIDAKDYHMYEIRDAIWRLIGETEKVLPIIKSGSALLVTDRLKGEKSENPVSTIPASSSPSPAPSGASTPAPDGIGNATSSSTTKLGKTGKPKREKASRSSDASGSAPNQTNGALSITRDNSRESVPRASPRGGENTQPPVPFSSSIQLLLWIFPQLPAGSMKATEWDPNTTLEGQVELKCAPTGSSIIITSGDATHTFNPSQMSPVEDSTRYFVMGTTVAKRIGLGFETRDEATKFKMTLQQMLQWDQLHSIDVDPPCTLTCVTQFTIGPLGFDQRMEDGFYDTGSIPAPGAPQPTLRELSQLPNDFAQPEVLSVNMHQDVRLERFVQVAEKLVPSGATIEERAKSLALFVSNVFGGIDISDGVGSLEDQADSPYASLEGISKDSITSLRTRTKSNIVKLGNVTHGVRRHRSLLFKYIADRLDPVLPSALARTTPLAATKSPAYGILIPFPSSADSYAYVDLVNEPGFSYPFESLVTSSFTTHMFGRLPSPSPSFMARLETSHAHIGQDREISSLPNPPNISDGASARAYEQIGFSTSSRVYRGAMGYIPVAIKEVNLEAAGVSAESLSAALNAQCDLVHPHIMATFGYHQDGGSMAVYREYCGLKSLADQAKMASSRAQPLAESSIWLLIRDIAAGVKYLHDKDQVHGNLSATNVLLDGDERLQKFTAVKLADPLLTQSHSPHTAHADSYRAPETVNDPAPSKPADIWSIGVILAELAAERFFRTPADFIDTLADGESEFGPYLKVILQCCQQDSAQRPTIDALLQTVQALCPSS